MNWPIFIATQLGFWVGILYYRLNGKYRKRKLISPLDDGWIAISTMPIPDDLEKNRYFIIVTDGKTVEEYKWFHYNSKGQPCIGYSSKEPITHWLPYPNPPRKKGIKVVK